MPNTARLTRRWRTTAAIAAVLAALTVAGCGSDDPAPPAHSGHDHSNEIAVVPDPATADPNTVTQQALAIMFTWQPVTDPSAGQAVRRAAPWLGGALAQAAAAPSSAGTVRPDPRWESWRRSADVVTATAVVDAGHIPDTASTALRTVTVRQQVLHADGDSTPLNPMRVEATLTHTTTGWRLTDYTVTAG